MFTESVVRLDSRDAEHLRLEPLHVPVSLDVLDGADTAVRCLLKTEVPCRLRLLWRVPFPALSHLLNRVTAGDALLYNCQTTSYDAGEHTVEASEGGGDSREEASAAQSGPGKDGAAARSDPGKDGAAAQDDGGTASAPRRGHYPLIAVVETTEAPTSPATVVALVAVIHVRDSAVPTPTSVLHRYVRQANGRVTLLQPLYRSGVEEAPIEDTSEAATGGASGGASEGGALGTCCVCLTLPATVVLLPCRHGCVCGDCFRRTQTCPLCRGRVSQYFTVQPQPQPQPQTSTQPQTQPQSPTQSQPS